MKKIHKKLMNDNNTRIKNKIKYVKRSKHAKNRKRDKNGKFLTTKKNKSPKKKELTSNQ